jgi:hypothetical protein
VPPDRFAIMAAPEEPGKEDLKMSLRIMPVTAVVLALVALSSAAPAAPQQPKPTTQPTTRPTTSPARALTADEMLSQMLRPPPSATGERVLQAPADPPLLDKRSGKGAVIPNAPAVSVMREGTFLVDRTGRLTKAADGTAEFSFESDGRALRDPPVVILPSLKLVAMEEAVKGANRDLRFRISGMVTEYRGRNYVLLEKVLVVPEVTQQF